MALTVCEESVLPFAESYSFINALLKVEAVFCNLVFIVHFEIGCCKGICVRFDEEVIADLEGIVNHKEPEL